MGAHIAIPFALPTSSGVVGPATQVKLASLTVAETGGSSTKTVVLRDSTSSGTVLAALEVAAGTGGTVTFHFPIQTQGQLYAVVSGSGTLAGSVAIL